MNINDMLGNEPVMQDRSPEGQIFAIEAEMKNLMEEYDVAARSGDQQRADAINNQIEKLQDIMIEIQNEMSNEGRGDIYNLSTPNIYNSRLRQSLESGDPDEIRKNQEDIKRSALQDIQSIEMSGMMEEYPNDSAKKIEELKRYSMNMGGEASSQHMMPDGTPMPGSNHQEYEAMMMQQRQMMASGGTPFPDLTGDGQITQADILKGRGVYAEGDEVMDVNNLPEDIKQKVENIYRKLYLSNPDIERNRRRPNTASLTNEENELLDQYTKGALRRDIPLLSKYMDMIGMDDIVNDNTLLQALKISSIGVGMAGALPTSRIRGAMNPELGIGNDPMFDKVMEERKETYGYAVGGEAIGDELEGMEMTEEQAMAELEESRGEFEQLQMLADVVKKLLNEGMGEAEIVAYLKEQGLDDEDIETLFSFLQEISGQESSMEQAPQGIDQQLQGMM